MNADSLFSLMDALIVACGFYVIYNAWTMMSTGMIKENSSLLPKDLDMRKCKDAAGFIKYIGPKQIVFGIVACICGGLGLLQDFTDIISPVYYLVAMIVLFAYLIWYAVTTKKAVKRFW